MTRDKTGQLTLLFFWLINGLGVALFILLGAFWTSWFQSAVISLLGTIFLNGLNLHIETRHALHERLRAAIVPNKEIYGFLMLSDHQLTKNEYVRIARILSEIEQALKSDEDVPSYAYDLAWEHAHERLRSAADNLKKISEGSIELRKDTCLEATIRCLEGADSTVFAISFPDVDFWRGEGNRYLEVNRKVLDRKRAEVKRFFIVRDNNEDLAVFRNEEALAGFAELLKLHAKLGKQSRGKLRTFLVHARQVNLQQVSESLHEIPDMCIYDGTVISQWLRREGKNGQGRIDRSIISFERDTVAVMKRLESYLENRVAKVEITDEATVDQVLADFQQRYGLKVEPVDPEC